MQIQSLLKWIINLTVDLKTAPIPIQLEKIGIKLSYFATNQSNRKKLISDFKQSERLKMSTII